MHFDSKWGSNLQIGSTLPQAVLGGSPDVYIPFTAAAYAHTPVCNWGASFIAGYVSNCHNPQIQPLHCPCLGLGYFWQHTSVLDYSEATGLLSSGCVIVCIALANANNK